MHSTEHMYSFDLHRAFAPEIAFGRRSSPDVVLDVVNSLSFLGIKALPVRVKLKSAWLTELDLIIDDELVCCVEERTTPGVWSISRGPGKLVGVHALAAITLPMNVRVQDREMLVADLLREASERMTLSQWWPPSGETTFTTLTRLASSSIDVMDEHTIFLLDANLFALSIQTVCNISDSMR